MLLEISVLIPLFWIYVHVPIVWSINIIYSERFKFLELYVISNISNNSTSVSRLSTAS